MDGNKLRSDYHVIITNFYQYAKKEVKLTADDVKMLWNKYALSNVD